MVSLDPSIVAPTAPGGRTFPRQDPAAAGDPAADAAGGAQHQGAGRSGGRCARWEPGRSHRC